MLSIMTICQRAVDSGENNEAVERAGAFNVEYCFGQGVGYIVDPYIFESVWTPEQLNLYNSQFVNPELSLITECMTKGFNYVVYKNLKTALWITSRKVTMGWTTTMWWKVHPPPRQPQKCHCPRQNLPHKLLQHLRMSPLPPLASLLDESLR